jgi:hypothetical protein
MSSYIIADDCTKDVACVPPTCKSKRLISPIFSCFNRPGGFLNSPVWFWEIRERGPPSDDITANAGDIYLDISTVPIDVYQKTPTGWTSCWSEPLCFESQRKFSMLPHPRFMDHFLWTTVANDSSSAGITLSYITHEELNSRGGTENDKQLYLLQDLKTLHPSITTAKTFKLAAQREALQAKQNTWLDSCSSSSTMGAGNDSDCMYVEEEDLCDDGDHDDEGTDKTILSAEVESMLGSEPVDTANEGSVCCKIKTAELTQSVSKEVEEIFSDPDSSTVTSLSTSNPPPKFESDYIPLLSRLNRSIEMERKENFAQISNCELFI